jgi:hypothetical protein
MIERKHERRVKDVSIDDDCVHIELLSGLRLSGPLRTNPVYRDPVVPVDICPIPTDDFVRPLAAT